MCVREKERECERESGGGEREGGRGRKRGWEGGRERKYKQIMKRLFKLKHCNFRNATKRTETSSYFLLVIAVGCQNMFFHC